MPTTIQIEDPLDSRLDPYRDVRDRDLKGRGDAFMAEGEVVLRLALARAPERLQSVLLSRPRFAAMETALAALPASVPVYVAPSPLVEQIAGFPLHRGVLALGARPPPSDPAALLRALPRKALVVGLVGIANHDNVGGILRNAAAFGADAVLIDPATCDPLYRKAIRVSVGASIVVPFARAASGDAMIDALEAEGFSVVALTPAARTEIGSLVPAERTGLLLGAEGPGLEPAIIARAKAIRIDMPGGIDSLNVATSSGIALHRIATAGGSPMA